MKVVPFFPNSDDNLHCLQACVKSVLAYYFPKRSFSDKKIDEQTGQIGGWSWLCPSVVYINSLGLQTKLFCPAFGFDYGRFSKLGQSYLKQVWGKERYAKEEANGALRNIAFVHHAAMELIDNGLWEDSQMETTELSKLLERENVLVIGKTIHEWLSGIDVNGVPHFALLIKEYSKTQWRIHDPGLPPIDNRKVNKMLNRHRIFGEIAVIYGLRQ